MSQRRRPPQRTPTPEATPAEAIPPIASTTSLERRVAAMLAMYQPFAGEPVVVAVSGGADSLSLLGALLALCAQSHPQAPGEIVVATFEHGLRGAAGQADARWVADFAAEQGVRCVVGQGDTHALARREHRSLEDAARRLRYAFLREVAAEVGAQYLCLGHTLDDQAETVLLNWLRGAGLAGLAGMRPVEGDLVRPLLTVTHSQTLAYCAARGWQPREDLTNSDRRFTRNRIRLDTLPHLETYNPNLRQALARNADLIAADEAYLEVQTDAAWAQTVIPQETPIDGESQPQRISFALGALLAQPLALRRRLLRRAGRGLSSHKGERELAARHIALLERLAVEGDVGDALDLPGGVRASRTADMLTLAKRDRDAPTADTLTPASARDEGDRETWELHIPGVLELPSLGWRVRAARLDLPAGLEGATSAADDALPPVPALPPIARAGTAAQLPHAELRVYMDADAIGQGPLRVRRWQAGDRFMPLGMKQEKKLQDYFADAKVPREMRTRLPIVLGPAHIVWVATQRIDERVRLTPDTAQVVALQCEPLSPTPDPSPALRERGKQSIQSVKADKRKRGKQEKRERAHA